MEWLRVNRDSIIAKIEALWMHHEEDAIEHIKAVVDEHWEKVKEKHNGQRQTYTEAVDG